MSRDFICFILHVAAELYFLVKKNTPLIVAVSSKNKAADSVLGFA